MIEPVRPGAETPNATADTPETAVNAPDAINRNDVTWTAGFPGKVNTLRRNHPARRRETPETNRAVPPAK